MVKMATCNKKDTLCADCKDPSCLHAGDKGADCPKYTCDNLKPNDCAHCAYIDGYLRIMRQQLRSKI